MSKFNKVKVASNVRAALRAKNTSRPTTNLAGGYAFTMKEKSELVSILLTSFVTDQYYRTSEDTLKRVAELVKNVKDKTFIAKAAVYARTEMGMRSISHAVAGELAKDASIKGQDWTKGFYNKIVRRVDDMLEIISYIWKDGKAPLPNALKKGFRSAFDRFDGYQLSKYQANNSDFKLVDLANLIHPIPTDRNREALNALVNGKLKNLTTSQRALTNIGQTTNSEEEKAELRGDYWVSVLTNGKLGYIDLVRSLTKIAKDAPQAVDLAVSTLTNKQLVQNSLIMPYQLYIALKMVEKDVGAGAQVGRKLISALETALELSCDNVPKFGGKTIVVVDRSGSMGSALSSVNNGIMTMAEAGTLMALFLARTNNCDFMIFGDTAKYVPYNAKDSILTSIKKLMSYNAGGGYEVGHGTNFHDVFKKMNSQYDRVIVFSDMQGWKGGHYGMDGDYASYSKKFGVKPFFYSHDLSGLGTLQMPEDKVFLSAGFNAEIFTVMSLLEQDKEALAHKIDAVQL